MTDRESDLLRRIQVAACRNGDVRLFRNNVGAAWLGKVQHNMDGSVTIHNPTRVVYGLGVGTSDLIGLRSVVITPEMVGQRVAIFAAVEVKRPGKRGTPEQKKFIEVVKSLGGLAGIASSVAQCEQVLTNRAGVDSLCSHSSGVEGTRR